MPLGRKSPSIARSGASPLVTALAFALPFLGALWQMRGDPLWRSDAAVLAALEDHGQLSGTLSTLLSRGALLLPLGSHGFRLALPGALFAGLAGLATLQLCHYLFQKQGGFSRLDSWLAMGASLSVSFSLPWMCEAGVTGGAALGGGLGLLLTLIVLRDGLPRTLFGAAWLGVLFGGLATESLWCAAVVATGALIHFPESGTLRSAAAYRHALSAVRSQDRSGHIWKVLTLIGCAALTVAVLWLPTLTHSSLEMVQAWSAAAAKESDMWPLWSPLGWISTVGFLWCLGAVGAAIFSLQDRRPVYVLVLLIAADVLAPGNGASGWSESTQIDPNRLGLHLLALGALGPLGALGLRTLGETAQALKLFAARPLAAMVAVLAIAGCLASAEDTLRTLEQTNTSGTQAWTDEALQSLPQRSLVLTQSPAWGRRLLAAQAQGERPDVLIVPFDDITRSGAISDWLKREPALNLLMRDLSLSETPSERAIARLIDTRPVFLEVDPTWDRRLLEHVRPTVPLASLSSHALGRSERLAAIETLAAPQTRITEAYQRGLTPDAATADVLNNSFDSLKKTLKVVHDGTSAKRLDDLLPSDKAEEKPLASPDAPLAALAR